MVKVMMDFDTEIDSDSNILTLRVCANYCDNILAIHMKHYFYIFLKTKYYIVLFFEVFVQEQFIVLSVLKKTILKIQF